MTSLLHKLLCLLGIHGPHWFGKEPRELSERTYAFERTCKNCGSVWKGTITDDHTGSTTDWSRVKKSDHTDEGGAL